MLAQNKTDDTLNFHLNEELDKLRLIVEEKRNIRFNQILELFNQFLTHLPYTDLDADIEEFRKKYTYYEKLRQEVSSMPYKHKKELFNEFITKREKQEPHLSIKQRIIEKPVKEIFIPTNKVQSNKKNIIRIIDNPILIKEKQIVVKPMIKSFFDKEEPVKSKDSKDFVKAKKEILQNKHYLLNIGNGDYNKGKMIIEKLLESKWYNCKELDLPKINSLLKIGYIKSGNNEVFNPKGKPESVIGFLEGRESLQHLSCKYFFANGLKKYDPKMEYLTKDGYEVDLVINKNNMKIAIEFELNQNTDHRLLSKVNSLETEFDFIYYATKKNCLNKFKDLTSKKIYVGTFNDVLNKINGGF